MTRAPWFLAVCVVLLAGCAGGPAADHGAGGGGNVTVAVRDVVDGDTVDVVYPNGSVVTVRLLGVDTPEVYGEVDPAEFEGVPDSSSGRTCLGRWGERASDFAERRLGGRTVELRFDPAAPRRGAYGRLLAYVYVDGASFNRRLVERGYARVFTGEFTRNDAYLDAERRARENGTGLWACAA